MKKEKSVIFSAGLTEADPKTRKTNAFEERTIARESLEIISETVWRILQGNLYEFEMGKPELLLATLVWDGGARRYLL